MLIILKSSLTIPEWNKMEWNAVFQNRFHLIRKFLIRRASVDVIQEIILSFSYDQSAQTSLQRG